MKEEVGDKNIFIFGMTVPEVEKLKQEGWASSTEQHVHISPLTHTHAHHFRYDPRKYYERNAELKKAIDQIHDGFFSPDEPQLFHSLTNHLLSHDT